MPDIIILSIGCTQGKNNSIHLCHLEFWNPDTPSKIIEVCETLSRRKLDILQELKWKVVLHSTKSAFLRTRNASSNSSEHKSRDYCFAESWADKFKPNTSPKEFFPPSWLWARHFSPLSPCTHLMRAGLKLERNVLCNKLSPRSQPLRSLSQFMTGMVMSPVCSAWWAWFQNL